MYTVYGNPMTRTLRVMWMLEELGQEYDLVPCNPHSPQIRELNPLGKLPAMKVDDVVLTDSVAIVTYLADHHGKLTFPAGTLDRARQDGLTQFIVDDMEGAIWTSAKNSFVLPEEMRVPAIKPQAKALFFQSVHALEKKLGDGPWLMGETFTIPDLLAGHLANWAQFGSKWEMPEADGPYMKYVARIRARPAFQAATARGKAAMAA